MPQIKESVPSGFASSVIDTVRNRGSDYGHPSDNHKLTAEMWSSWLKRRLGVEVTLTPEDVCMLNVLQKASRLANTTKDDSWLDIAGYTENVAMLPSSMRNIATTDVQSVADGSSRRNLGKDTKKRKRSRRRG